MSQRFDKPFTAAQAAQKRLREAKLDRATFTAAQAAQKRKNAFFLRFSLFTAAQAAQKELGLQLTEDDLVHCRTGSSEILMSKV